MSTNVRIKQKSLFKKKLEMKDIVALTGLAYGVIDDIVNLKLLLGAAVALQYFFQAHHDFQHFEGLYNVIFSSFFQAFYFA